MKKIVMLAAAAAIMTSGLVATAPASARTLHHYYGAREFVRGGSGYLERQRQSPASESNGSQAWREYHDYRSPTDSGE